MREDRDKSVAKQLPRDTKQSDTQQRIIQIGSKVKVQWTAEEVKGTNWKVGWYTATVNS